jgi:ligand-binding sensor domain-containing protein
MEDKTGTLWICTREEAYTYDGKTFTTLTNNDGKAFNNVWGIIEDSKGNIWFGSYSEGVCSKTGELWLGGGTNGVLRFNGRSFERIY